MRVAYIIVTGIFGAFVGTIAGLFGDGVLAGLVPGAITGGIIGFVKTIGSPTEEIPLIAFESFGFGGGIAGFVSSLAANNDLTGTLVTCSLAYIAGSLSPVLILALFLAVADDKRR